MSFWNYNFLQNTEKWETIQPSLMCVKLEPNKEKQHTVLHPKDSLTTLEFWKFSTKLEMLCTDKQTSLFLHNVDDS